VISTLLLTDSVSTIVDSDPPYFAPLPTDPPLMAVEMNISIPSDLDLPIAL